MNELVVSDLQVALYRRTPLELCIRTEVPNPISVRFAKSGYIDISNCISIIQQEIENRLCVKDCNILDSPRFMSLELCDCCLKF